MHTPNSLIPVEKAALDELPPTYELYGELQFAYEHFNRELWGGKLPHCLITLQRRRKAYGYFAASRFARPDGRRCDEIAMNPRYFQREPVMETLSTLVHEMAHLWQQHFGKPGRGRYHNKQWAREMLRVGLHPFAVNGPPGKMTGDSVSHHIVAGGAFQLAARRLMETPLGISWGDAPPCWQLSVGGVDVEQLGQGQAGQRTKFTCPACAANAWGKASLKLLCRLCDRPMLAPGERERSPPDDNAGHHLSLAIPAPAGDAAS